MKLTQELLRELMDYDMTTGVCVWKFRNKKLADMGYCDEKSIKIFNSKNANKQVGHKNALIGCFTTRVFTRVYRLHRLIWFYMTGEWPKVIDHINGDSFDNRWDNLRNVSQLENCKNMRMHRRNVSGIAGVSFVSDRNRWQAYISKDGKRIALGRFLSFEEAVMVRRQHEEILGYSKRHGKRDGK